MEVPVEGSGILCCGGVEIEGGDGSAFPVQEVYLFRFCSEALEGAAHAPLLEDAAAVGEDLDSCSDLDL